MSNIVPLQDIQHMAEVAASSKMFGFKNPQEAMAIMLLCQAEGLHPAIAQGGSLEVTWTLKQAKEIGIASKDNWKNYPRAMLRARVISEGIRAVFPGCVVGVYTPEEVADFAPAQTVKHMGDVERVEDVHEVALAETEEEGAFPLFVPGSDEPYKRYATPEDWITGYADMVSRIILCRHGFPHYFVNENPCGGKGR